MKDRTEILAKPISELCNFSTTLRGFPDACRIEKLKPILKKGSEINHQGFIKIHAKRIVLDQTHDFLSPT